MQRPLKTGSVILVALALVAGACGDDSDDDGAATSTEASSTTASDDETDGAPVATEGDDPTGCGLVVVASEIDGEFPVTITSASGSEITLDAAAQSIVSLSPTATEMIVALGAGDQLAATGDQSNCPVDAPVADGLSDFEPSVEAIAALDPDLVVMSFDPGGIVDGLTALDIPALVQFSALSLQDTYDQISELGLATGRVSGAEALNASIRDDLDGLATGAAVAEPGETYYHELSPDFYSVTTETFLGELYGLLGLESIADPADDGSGFPQLNQEFIVGADPDYIVVDDCCGETAATVSERPGWADMAAVSEGRILEVDDDLASRWGPRVVNYLGSVVEGLDALSGG